MLHFQPTRSYKHFNILTAPYSTVAEYREPTDSTRGKNWNIRNETNYFSTRRLL